MVSYHVKQTLRTSLEQAGLAAKVKIGTICIEIIPLRFSRCAVFSLSSLQYMCFISALSYLFFFFFSFAE